MQHRENTGNREESDAENTVIEILVLWLLVLAWPALFIFSMYVDTRVPIELEMEPAEDVLFGQVDDEMEYHEWN